MKNLSDQYNFTSIVRQFENSNSNFRLREKESFCQSNERKEKQQRPKFMRLLDSESMGTTTKDIKNYEPAK